MMVIVPRFAHGDQSKAGDIVALDRGSFHDPCLRTYIVGDVANEPMSGQRNRDSNADAPHDPRQASKVAQAQCQWQLL